MKIKDLYLVINDETGEFFSDDGHWYLSADNAGIFTEEDLTKLTTTRSTRTITIIGLNELIEG